jgi:hypothetical protein
MIKRQHSWQYFADYFSKFLLLGFLLTPCISKAQLSGKVFRDINVDGLYASGEYPEAGIRVVAYSANGDSITQVTTVAALNGSGDNYSFSGLTFPIRLEFRIPNFLYGAKGSVGNSTVQFFTVASSSADFAVEYPSLYCQNDPNIMIPCYVTGNPEGGGTGGSLDAYVSFPYSRVGSTLSPTHIANANEIGTVWGSAYQRESQKVILSAFLKRHCGLEALGLGGLFIGDMATAPGAISSYINIENFGINVGSSLIASRATLPSLATATSTDPLAFDNMGKIGIGSIDLSDDGKVLWGVNLHTKSIFSFKIGNPFKAASAVTSADFASFPIPNPGCTNGVSRPWAIEFYEGKIYVGTICSGETGGSQSNLFAYIYRFDPATNNWNPTPVVSFALNYAKGDVHSSFPTVDKWETWANVFSDLRDNGTAGTPAAIRKMRPQPILTDIQFDTRGNLILGFSDRTGHQTGRNQLGTSGTTLYNGYIGGDILYLKSNGAGGFTLENNGSITGQIGGGVGNMQGPGGGEFFSGDFYDGVLTVGQPAVQIHQETMQGGLVYHPGRNEIMANHIDPFSVFSGGVMRHSVTNGYTDDNMRYQIYNTITANGTFGKANGLGLLEMACDAAPIEIGNRVWIDTDFDGQQDANELGVDGVIVKLKLNGTTVSTTTTTNGGQYYFTNLSFQTTYTIEIESFATQSSLLGRILTSSNINSDATDNDAMVIGNNAVITYTTGLAGQNNHTLDFGFRCAPVIISSVSETAATCNGSTPNNDAKLTIFTSGNKSGISSAGASTYDGAAYAAATSIFGGSVMFSNLLGAGGTYIVRIFSGNDVCYKDTTITIATTICSPPCITISNVSAGPCTVTPLNYTATTVNLTLTWTGVTGNIILIAGAGSQIINTTIATSPLTITFDQLTDGQVHPINAYSENTPSCNSASSFTSPPSCTGILGCDNTGGTITGTVFDDLNNNGLIDGGEGGFSGIDVKVYSAAGTIVGSAMTDVSGNYIINGLSENVRIRIEFSNIPNSLEPVANGIDNTTAVYFSTAPDCINFGLRDIASTAASQDVEIGNFVWHDEDGDGVQDPNENPIENVSVKLYNRFGALVGTTTTNAQGLYYFNKNNVDTTGGAGQTGLSPNTPYYVVFGMGQTTNLLLFDSLSATTVNAGIGAIPDQNDSDGQALTASAPGALATMVGLPAIYLTTPGAGGSNHSYDMGFCARPNGGLDETICQPTTTAKLNDAVVGTQVWSAVSGNPSLAIINAQTGEVTGMTALGDYKFVLSNTSGNCNDTVIITRVAKPIIANASAQICTGSTLDLTAFIANYNTYLNPIWKKDAANGLTVASPTSVNPTETSDYYFIGSNVGNCSDTALVTVTILPEPVLQIVNAACNGAVYNVTFTADGGAVITSTLGTVFGNTVTGIPNGTNITITTSLTTGGATCQKSVDVTAPDCSCPTVNAPSISQGSYAICAGDAFMAFTVTTGANTEVDWYDAASGGNLLLANSLTYTPSVSGTFYAIAHSTLVGFTTCISVPTEFSVTVNPKPVIDDAAVSECIGKTIDLTANILGYGSYSNPVWHLATINGAIVSTPTAEMPSSSTVYVLVAENNSGCSDVANMTVTMNENPTITLNSTNCAINLLTYSVNFIATGDDNTADKGTVIGSSVSFIPIGESVTITTTNSATGCSEILNVSSPNCPCPSVSAPLTEGDKTICAGDSIPTLSVQVGNGETVDWYDAAIGGNQIATATTSYLPTVSGTYYAETRVLANNCLSASRTAVTFVINPSIVFSGRDTTVCMNTVLNLGDLVTNFAPTLNRKWSIGNLEGTTLSNDQVIISATETYYLIAENSFGCKDTTNLTVTALDLPSLICAKTDLTKYQGTDGTAKVTASGGTPAYSYLWSNAATTDSLSGLSTGDYVVTVTDLNGCSAVCNSFIDTFPCAIITISPDSLPNGTVGEPYSVQLNAAGGTSPYQFLWAVGTSGTLPTGLSLNNAGLFSGTPTGVDSYAVKIIVKDLNECPDTLDPATITILPACMISATFTQNSCNNNNTLSITTDDYFTVTVSGVSATNSGASGKYEVILNGTVLNTGGTDYGTPINIGTSTTFKSDGISTYNLKVRDIDKPMCETTVFTTATSMSCSILPCPAKICVPITVIRSN